MEPNMIPGARGAGGFVKKNKLLVSAVAAGGAFIYLSQKGAAVPGSATIVPVQAAPDESSNLAGELVDRYSESQDTAAERQHEKDLLALSNEEAAKQREYDAAEAEAQRQFDAAQADKERAAAAATAGPTDPSTAAPADPADDAAVADAPDADPAPVASASGITIAGRFFAGAIGSQVSSSGNTSAGHYITHLLRFASRTEKWNHYIRDKAGKRADFWRGPFGTNVTAAASGANPTAPVAPSPAPAPAPQAGGTLTAVGPVTGLPAVGPVPLTGGTDAGASGAQPKGGPPPPSGFTEGAPNGFPSSPFLVHGVARRNNGSGSDSHGGYVGWSITARQSAGGPWAPPVGYRHYNSGAYDGRWVPQ